MPPSRRKRRLRARIDAAAREAALQAPRSARRAVFLRPGTKSFDQGERCEASTRGGDNAQSVAFRQPMNDVAREVARLAAPSVDHAKLSALDLNLLVSFDALMTERHVTRAAARIGIKQAAMSHALNRLRGLLGDELFTRRPGGIEPTPRAHALSQAVREMLVRVAGALFVEQRFDPAREEHRFRLGMPASLEIAMLPVLIEHLTTEAPRISFAVAPLTATENFRALDTGELDIVIGPPLASSPHHKRRQICAEPYLCVFNPELVSPEGPRGTLTLRQFLAARHVRVSPRFDLPDVVDDALVELKRRRRVGVHTSCALGVAYIVERAPMIGILPRSAAQLAARQFTLACCAPPIALAKNRVVMTWHGSNDANAGHRWLRDQMVRTAAILGRARK
ncbi:LysR family transcriptional regulator [Pendulispora albinea]|uniref:LysR family transcriptional regulator n=1 Tax=Pendulispora albinea TaxID=2741071 RepID=UPI00374E08DD